MQEQTQLQPIPVKIYRTHDHLTVAAPMPGLEPEDILVEVTENGQLKHANVTYGNGVLVVAFLLSQETHPARITLAKTGIAHGEYRGNIGGHLQA